MTIQTRVAGVSDVGRIRKSNQDSGYTGYNLFFVADGMGGHAGGDIASALTTQSLAHIDENYHEASQASKALVNAMWSANSLLTQTVKDHAELAGMGTTVSALLFADTKAVIGHIGDSRIYLVRDSAVKQITTDHTFVQRLVDTGRITPAEALTHPRRSVLMRVLGDVEEFPEIDTQAIETKPGDRWMLCSDGLTGALPEDLMNGILLRETDPAEAADLLVGEAIEYGAPDNVTVVIVDVLPLVADEQPASIVKPSFLGSAANEVVIEVRKGARMLQLLNPRTITDLFTPDQETSSVVPESEEYLEKILKQTKTRIRNRWIRQLLVVLLWIGIAVGSLSAGYSYTQTRFYVGVFDGHVAIYQGIKESLGPFKFSHLYDVTGVDVTALPEYQQSLVADTVSAENLPDARRIVETLALLASHG